MPDGVTPVLDYIYLDGPPDNTRPYAVNISMSRTMRLVSYAYATMSQVQASVRAFSFRRISQLLFG
jgi:hypothetical protein